MTKNEIKVDYRTLQALLKRYECPLKFYQVRACFMGSIASPVSKAAPFEEIDRIWGGEMPKFNDPQETQTFLNTLLVGVWNVLCEHGKRNKPFKLIRIKSEHPSYEYLVRIADIRYKEVEGFLEGLHAGQKVMELPEVAYDAAGILSEMQSQFEEFETSALKPLDSDDQSGMKQAESDLQKMTQSAEIEINKVIQSCQKLLQHGVEMFDEAETLKSDFLPIQKRIMGIGTGRLPS